MSEFSSRLIAWQKIHGRHNLPWQNTTDPYALYLSEIMLQQTQVTAVIGYYTKFMQRFPDIATLADATQEEVLQYWSGLGYYSRARNLHNTASIIMDTHHGVFPSDVAVMQSLPGIGRSTAAAIASFAFNQIETILDGNVKRVLARHFLVEGWTSSPKVEKALWDIAESLLPEQGMVAYTQGLMDLGSTVCTRSKPKCSECPLKASCKALAENRTKDLPTPKPKKVIPQKQTTMLLILNGNEVMLEKRPQSGIWAGLWSFPEISMHEIASEVALKRFGLEVEAEEPLAIIQHVFTHFKLEISPQTLQVTRQVQTNKPNTIWLPIEDAISAAIPAPVRRILQSLTTIRRSS
jgi:A/G-specific adenine glycosylase